MILSPPLQIQKQASESHKEWIFRSMPVDNDRAYPVSKYGSWHGGIHIKHTDTGAVGEQIVAITEGEVAYAREPEDKDAKPLNYIGATDNGCVLIRHKIVLDEQTNLTVIFYSLSMHLKQVFVKKGEKLKAEQAIGTPGQVDGTNGFHFEICCDDENFKKLVGRSEGILDISKEARTDASWGREYYYIPAKQKRYTGQTILHPVGFPTFAKINEEAWYTVSQLGEPLHTILTKTEDGEYIHLSDNDAPREDNKEALLALIKQNPSPIHRYTSADFPDWVGWQIVNDDQDSNSQCNSNTIQQWKEQSANHSSEWLTQKYAGAICYFPFEWNFSTFDQRFDWLKGERTWYFVGWKMPPTLTDEDYEELKKHVKQLCFVDKLSAEDQSALSNKVWHFDPRMFISEVGLMRRITSHELYRTTGLMDDFTADDLQYGDKTKEQIIELFPTLLGRLDLLRDEEFHKASFLTIGKMTSWWGDSGKLFDLMYKQFIRGDNSKFTHPLLNDAIKKHYTMKNSLSIINEAIHEFLMKNTLNFREKNLVKKVNEAIANSTLPKFIGKKSWIDGTGITVHDTAATIVTLKELIINADEYTAVINYKIQDHFGLDVPDVTEKYFEYLASFRSWFILQRYNEYKGKYTPFITEMDVDMTIRGDLNGKIQ